MKLPLIHTGQYIQTPAYPRESCASTVGFGTVAVLAAAAAFVALKKKD